MRRTAGYASHCSQRLQFGLAAEQDGQRKGERGAAQLIDRRADSRGPRAREERVTSRAGQIKRRGQRAHGVDVRPPSFPALQRTHAVNRQARDRRELLLRVARSLAKRFELRAK